MLCILIELESCENERISVCLKFLNTISRLFQPKDTFSDFRYRKK